MNAEQKNTNLKEAYPRPWEWEEGHNNMCHIYARDSSLVGRLSGPHAGSLASIIVDAVNGLVPPEVRRTVAQMAYSTERYRRVIPRDLFNESDLLKCLGRLSLMILDEHPGTPAGLDLIHTEAEGFFRIGQDPSDGSIQCHNLVLARADGMRADLKRNLNDREPWPLFLCDENDEEVPVFDGDGNLTPEFIAWAKEVEP